MQPFLPESIVSRKEKQAFIGGEMREWLRGPLAHLLESDFTHLDVLDQKKVRQIVSDYRKGSNVNTLLIWRLASLNDWFNREKDSTRLRSCA
jgi:hypothetical protein